MANDAPRHSRKCRHPACDTDDEEHEAEQLRVDMVIRHSCFFARHGAMWESRLIMTGAIAVPMCKDPVDGPLLGGVRVATLESVALTTSIQIACGSGEARSGRPTPTNVF